MRFDLPYDDGTASKTLRNQRLLLSAATELAGNTRPSALRLVKRYRGRTCADARLRS
jgi:hypothetical protein